MQIRVSDGTKKGKRVLLFRVEDHYTVGQLKLSIEDKEQIPVEEQKLTYKRRVVSNEEVLSSVTEDNGLFTLSRVAPKLSVQNTVSEFSLKVADLDDGTWVKHCCMPKHGFPLVWGFRDKKRFAPSSRMKPLLSLSVLPRMLSFWWYCPNATKDDIKSWMDNAVLFTPSGVKKDIDLFKAKKDGDYIKFSGIIPKLAVQDEGIYQIVLNQNELVTMTEEMKEKKGSGKKGSTKIQVPKVTVLNDPYIIEFRLKTEPEECPICFEYMDGFLFTCPHCGKESHIQCAEQTNQLSERCAVCNTDVSAVSV